MGEAACASGDTVSFATSCTDGAGTDELLQPDNIDNFDILFLLLVIASSIVTLKKHQSIFILLSWTFQIFNLLRITIHEHKHPSKFKGVNEVIKDNDDWLIP